MRMLSQFIPLLLLLVSCTGKPAGPEEPQITYEKMVEQVSLPSSITISWGSIYKVAGTGFMEGDKFLFEAADAKFYVDLKIIGPTEVSFFFGDDFVSGTEYDVFLERGKTRRQRLGKMTVYFKGEEELTANISGTVTCSGMPVQGVWVTDGYLWCKTSADGKYKLLSKKKLGLVYIVTPSGYEVDRTDAFPPFWQSLSSSDPLYAEVHDFSLTRTGNDKHTVLFTADWHLRNEWNPKDIVQVQDYLNEADAFAKSSSCPVYSIPLGDISWEICWYDHNFDLSDWRALVAPSAMPVYPVIGNHDHDYKASGNNSDFDAEVPWRSIIGPTYYSMDIGKVHYLFVDNVLYHSDGTGNVRETEETITSAQLAWIQEDLSHVNALTPVVVSLHVPMHSWSWKSTYWQCSSRGKNYSSLTSLLEKFSKVYIHSGHSHISEYFDVNAAGLSYSKITERKIAALGGSLWRTRTLTGYSVAIDGTSAGYDIFEVDGTDVTWRYKSIGHDASYQMRAYDMNKVREFWQSDVTAKSLSSSKPDYSYENMWGGLPANTVLMNVFAGDPKQFGMKLEVYEGDKKLEVKPWSGCDPLHVLAYEVNIWKKSGSLPTGVSYLTATSNSHLFTVTASSATSTLTLKLSDPFGRKYEYSVKLPKEFKDEDTF